jgi:hypothetical protein
LGHWQAITALLLGIDLLAFGWGLAPGTDAAVYHTPVASAEFLQSQPPGRLFVSEPYAQEVYDKYVSLSAFGPADPTYLQGLRESLLPNLNSVHHLPGVGNYDPLTIGLYRDLMERIEAAQTAPRPDEAQRLLSLFGARYISGGEWPAPLENDGPPATYRHDGALPEALVVYQARISEDPAARLAALADPAFDPRRQVILSLLPAEPLPAGPAPDPLPEATVERPGPDRVVVQVRATQPGYLVLTDTYYPGWRATVDGELAEIVPANHAFRAVRLGAGAHTVVFEYSPLSFRLGAWTTLGAGLLLVATLASGWLTRRRER